MTTDRSKECENDTLKPLKIRVIWVIPFILLAKKWNYKIFTIIIKDIKKALEPKQYINSWPFMPKEYYNLINKFEK